MHIVTKNYQDRFNELKNIDNLVLPDLIKVESRWLLIRFYFYPINRWVNYYGCSKWKVFNNEDLEVYTIDLPFVAIEIDRIPSLRQLKMTYDSFKNLCNRFRR